MTRPHTGRDRFLACVAALACLASCTANGTTAAARNKHDGGVSVRRGDHE